MAAENKEGPVAAFPFSEIWMADFEFVADTGEQQRPVLAVGFLQGIQRAGQRGQNKIEGN